MLPPLLELITLIAYLVRDFFSIKFEEDLWPELVTILRCSLTLDEHSSGSQSNTAAEDRNCRPNTSTNGSGSSTSKALTKYSLASKVKIAAIECISQFVHYAIITVGTTSKTCINDDYSFVRKVSGVILWHTLAFMHPIHGETVNMAVMHLIRKVYVLDTPWIRTVLRALVDSSDCISGSIPSDKTTTVSPKVSTSLVSSNSVSSAWMAISADPRILKSYMVNGISLSARQVIAPGSTNLYNILINNAIILQKIYSVLNDDIDEYRDNHVNNGLIDENDEETPEATSIAWSAVELPVWTMRLQQWQRV